MNPVDALRHPALALGAGLAATALAYAINSALLPRLGEKGYWLMVPPGEELAKTGLALAAGAHVVGVHLVFGLVEASHELRASRRPLTQAAALAVVTHAFFGILTVAIAARAGWVGAIAAVSVFHGLFNCLMVAGPAASPGGGRER